MEKLKQIKEKLINCVEDQINCLENASAQELGEAVDMIKDLDEAIYYCTMTKTIEDKYSDYGDKYYYSEKRPMQLSYRGDDYYQDGSHMGNMTYYHHEPYRDSYGYGYGQPKMMPEYGYQDGSRSGMRRKMYMEGKVMHHDKNKQMQELEAYVQDLGQDITEMIQDASPEEKQLLQQKISILANKIK